MQWFHTPHTIDWAFQNIVGRMYAVSQPYKSFISYKSRKNRRVFLKVQTKLPLDVLVENKSNGCFYLLPKQICIMYKNTYLFKRIRTIQMMGIAQFAPQHETPISFTKVAGIIWELTIVLGAL